MAVQVMANCKIAVGGFDLSGRTNSFELGYGAEMLDRTAFNSSFRRRAVGLNEVTITGSGFFGSSEADKGVHGLVGSTAEPVTLAASTTDAARAFMANHVFSDYSAGGTIGDLMGFDFAGVGDGTLVQGKALTIRHDTTTISSTFRSTGINLGTVTTSKRLYATFHYTGTTEGSTAGINSSGGSIRGWVIGSCSSNCASGGSTNLGTTMLAIPAAATSGIGGTWASTKLASTAQNWFQFRYATTGGKPHLSFMCAAGLR
jgi:hypothetical protein